MSYTGTKIKVIYILGAARSGSTVLDIALGNHPKIIGVGELKNLAKSVWIKNEYCSCGRPGNECVFWNDVINKWKKRTKKCEHLLQYYLWLQQKFERTRKVLKIFSKNNSYFKEYSDYTTALFEAIRMVSKRSIIVDSSKNVARAIALSRVSGVDLYILHLVRDLRGVAWSQRKSYKKNLPGGIQRDFPGKSIWSTAADWCRVNLFSNWVRMRMDFSRTILIRYEDFVNEPARTIQKIGDLLCLDSTPLLNKISSGRPMLVGHMVSGNRVRMNPSIKLKKDAEWTKKMSAKNKKLTWILAWFLMRIYQYNIQGN